MFHSGVSDLSLAVAFWVVSSGKRGFDTKHVAERLPEGRFELSSSVGYNRLGQAMELPNVCVEKLRSVRTLHAITGNEVSSFSKSVNDNHYILHRDAITGTTLR